MSIETNSNPYVISQDVGRLVSNWGLREGFSVPSQSYFKGMTLELENVLNGIFPSVEIIDDVFLANGMNSLIESSGFPVVSLDRCYVDESSKKIRGFLDVSRCVDCNFEKIGINGRNIEGINSQLDLLIKKLGTNKEIAIVDDVLFEGKTHKYVAELFANKGIKVKEVIVGISIGDGKKVLEENGLKVRPLVNYGSVVDEICERDFSAGVPFSGRTVITDKGVYGAPYFYPFGKPGDWASVPSDKVGQFSSFCMESSIGLWSNIEKMSRRPISTEEVPKKIFGLPKNDSIVDALSVVRSSSF